MAFVTRQKIRWAPRGLLLEIHITDAGIPCIGRLVDDVEHKFQDESADTHQSELALNSVRSNGEGNTGLKTAKSLVGSRLSSRLHYRSHESTSGASSSQLDITSVDDILGIEVTHHFIAFHGVPVLRSFASVKNTSPREVRITQISSLTIGGLVTGEGGRWWQDYSILTSNNSWFREAQWQARTLSDAGIDEIGLSKSAESMAAFSLASRGSFSTGTYLPMGALRRDDDRDTWLWQIEHNGSWRWELGAALQNVYLSAGGPTQIDHDFEVVLAPEDTFTSVPVSCCHVNGSIEDAFAAMTDYRRAIMRRHEDHERLPIIFNDYMNCLMGDPDEDKIRSLLDPVARSGAEYFVIDAGWYADDGDWWDDVGLWSPSPKRFPSGFKTLLQEIKNRGLVPGLWLEPEVVGVRSIVGEQLDERCFFSRDGKRVIERGRFQLDFRQAEVRQRLYGIVKHLIVEYGVGYFKFDYNIEVMSGSDSSAISTGLAHLEHQRAYLAWVSQLLDEFPALVLENCSSGAMRMDYAMLATHTLQSTSDQEDPNHYAAIAAAAPTAVVPEQSATWAYPQPQWDHEQNALCVVNSLLGRIHLSGRLDQLRQDQCELIGGGMDVYKSIRAELKTAHPFWPLGFPKWHDEWLSLGMKCQGGDMLVSVWRRAGTTSRTLPLPFKSGEKQAAVALLYPQCAHTKVTMSGSSLFVDLPNQICARLVRITLS